MQKYKHNNWRARWDFKLINIVSQFTSVDFLTRKAIKLDEDPLSIGYIPR